MKKLFRKFLSAIVINLLAYGISFAHGDVTIPQEKPNLAATPPMGWNSWNKFKCNIDEVKVRAQVDAMVTSGMKDAGYKYIVIDDCWQGKRDENGNITADPVKFPSGIKALADYVHSKGLKFGIYSDAGIKTCAGYPGSAGHEFQDARTYASWGVDFLKYDWCFTGTRDAEEAYRLMAMALRQSGRDILFSICEWGDNEPSKWAHKYGHMWRTTGDVHDRWNENAGYSLGFLTILDKQAELSHLAGPNRWNDPDMMEIGNGGMTNTEYKSYFSLWSILAAPLIAGNDLSNMSKETIEILTNKDVIAIDQDPLGIQGKRIRKDGDLEVWARPLADGGRAVVLFNRSSTKQKMSVNWTELNLPKNFKANVKNLWTKEEMKKVSNNYSADVESHGVVMIRISE